MIGMIVEGVSRGRTRLGWASFVIVSASSRKSSWSTSDGLSLCVRTTLQLGRKGEMGRGGRVGVGGEWWGKDADESLPKHLDSALALCNADASTLYS
jgi:hypothetical protein